MSRNIIDIKNKKFGDLTVIEFVKQDKNKNSIWLCKCKCGNKKEIKAVYLKNGDAKSCGCRRVNSIIERSIKHGMCNTRFYSIYCDIKKRCNNKKTSSYKNYGGRGIKLCRHWHKFENFRDDMYEDYLKHVNEFGEKDTSIDRVNNDGNYYKSNCRWATRIIQNNNKRKSNFIHNRDKNGRFSKKTFCRG